MYAEDDLLPISALQHLAFCERQWGLIHLEGIWNENRLTAEGRLMHDRVHRPETESRPGVRVARSLRIHSFRLGLVGQTDIVEFRQLPDETGNGIRLNGTAGRWQPRPVEFKRGVPKAGHCDTIQLCAQAMCLEEMLDVLIEEGDLYYGRTHRRYEVVFNGDLRKETEDLAVRLHALFTEGRTPRARYSRKCDGCSLVARCMPKVTGPSKDIDHYLASARKIEEDDTSEATS